MNKRWSSTSTVLETWDKVVLDTKSCCESSRHPKAEVAIVTLHLTKGITPQLFPFSFLFLFELTCQSTYIWPCAAVTVLWFYIIHVDTEPTVHSDTNLQNLHLHFPQCSWSHPGELFRIPFIFKKCKEYYSVHKYVLSVICFDFYSFYRYFTMQKLLKINFKFTIFVTCVNIALLYYLQ